MKKSTIAAIGTAVVLSVLSAAFGMTKPESKSGSAASGDTFLTDSITIGSTYSTGQARAVSLESAADSAGTTDVSDTGRKLVRTANLGFYLGENPDIAECVQMISDAAKASGGWLSESEMETGETPSVRITAMVPYENSEGFIESLSGYGMELISKSETATDVTETYVDTESRLETKRELKEKYTGYLKEAENISEVMEIENALYDVIGDIEAYEAVMENLDLKTQYVKVNITINGREEEQGFIERITEIPGELADEAADIIIWGLGFVVRSVLFLIFITPVTFLAIKGVQAIIRSGKKDGNKKEE